MKLFEVINNQPQITTEILLVPEFKKIWDKDKSKDKSKAFKELSYIYFSTDYKSLYLAYDPEVREERLLLDFIGDIKWKPDADIKTAIEKYKDLQKTPSIGFLEDAMMAVDATRKYFRGVDYTQLDDSGRPIYKIKEVTDALKNCEGIINTLDKLRDKVAKEQQLGTRARGGGTGGLLENE